MATPDTQTALQKLQRLSALAEFVSDLRQVRKGFRVVRVHDAARVNCLLLRLAEVPAAHT